MKILLTEKQLDNLINYIVENDNDDNDKDKNDIDNPYFELLSKEEEVLDEIRNEFITTIKSIKKCDDLIIKFASENPEGELENETIIRLRVMSKGNDGIKFKAMQIFNSKNLNYLNAGKMYKLIFNDCVSISKKDGLKLKLYSGKDEPIIINNFQIFMIDENKGNCDAPVPNIKKSYKTLVKKFTQLNKVLKKTEFEPSLLNMNNIFFFPKGFKAIEQSIKKLGGDPNPNKNKQIEVEFKVIKMKPNETRVFRSGAIITGVLDPHNNILLDKHYIETPTDNLEEDKTYNGNLHKKDGKSRYFVGHIVFKITDIKAMNSLSKLKKDLDDKVSDTDSINDPKEKKSKDNEVDTTTTSTGEIPHYDTKQTKDDQKHNIGKTKTNYSEPTTSTGQKINYTTKK